MASNKKAQILAAVMCASSIFGSYTVVSAADTPTKIESTDKNSSVTANGSTITATAGAQGSQQSTITLGNKSLAINVGKQTTTDGTTYGTFTLNSSNLAVNNSGLSVKNTKGIVVGSISNTGAITGTGLTIKNGTGTTLASLNNNGLNIYDGINTKATATITKAGAITGTGLTVKAVSDPIKPEGNYVESKVTTSGVADTIKQGGFTRATSNVTTNSIKDTIYTDSGTELSSINVFKNTAANGIENGKVSLTAKKIVTDNQTSTTTTSTLTLGGDNASLKVGNYGFTIDSNNNVLFSGKNASLTSTGLIVNGTGTSSIKSTNTNENSSTVGSYTKNDISYNGMTTTAKGGKYPSDSDNDNKTTSSVTYTGVRDTVYDDSGNIKSTSVVDTNGITLTSNRYDTGSKISSSLTIKGDSATLTSGTAYVKVDNTVGNVTLSGKNASLTSTGLTVNGTGTSSIKSTNATTEAYTKNDISYAGMTTTVRGGKNPSESDNVNKTTSAVTYTGVTDTVYDDGGNLKTKSSVTTSGITNTVYDVNTGKALANSSLTTSGISNTTTDLAMTGTNEGKKMSTALYQNSNGISASATKKDESGATIGTSTLTLGGDNASLKVGSYGFAVDSNNNVSINGKNATLSGSTFTLKDATNGKTVASLGASGLNINNADGIKVGGISNTGYLMANDGMNVTDKNSSWVTIGTSTMQKDITATTTTSYAGITNKIDTTLAGNKTYTSGTVVGPTSVTTTVQGSNTTDAISGNKNKTTSTVSATGVTDTVYNVKGNQVASSSVTTNGIVNTTTNLSIDGSTNNTMSTSIYQDKRGISASATKKDENGTVGTSTLTLAGNSASLKVGNYGFAVDSNNNASITGNNVSITGNNATLSGSTFTLKDGSNNTARLTATGLSFTDASGQPIGGVSSTGAITGTSLNITAKNDAGNKTTSTVGATGVTDRVYDTDGTTQVAYSNVGTGGITNSTNISGIAIKDDKNNTKTMNTSIAQNANGVNISSTKYNVYNDGTSKVQTTDGISTISVNGAKTTISGYGYKYEKDENGKLILDEKGNPIRSSNTSASLSVDGDTGTISLSGKNASLSNSGLSLNKVNSDGTTANYGTWNSSGLTVTATNTTGNKTISQVSATGVTDRVYDTDGKTQVAYSSVGTGGISNTTTALQMTGTNAGNTMSTGIYQNNGGISATATKKDVDGNTIGTSTLSLGGNSASLKVGNYGFAVDSSNNVSISGNNATLSGSTFTLKDGSNNTARLTATGLSFTDASGQPIGGVSSTGAITGTSLRITTSEDAGGNKTVSTVATNAVTDTVTNTKTNNKTTSQVSATGVRDTVYDANNKTVASSTVTTSGISNNTNISGIAIKDDKYNTKTMSTSIAQNANGVNISSTKYNVYNDGTSKVQTTDGISTISVNGAKTTISGYGYKYEKDENGKPILDEKGNPIRSSNTNASLSVDGESGIIGLSGKNVGLSANGLTLYKDVEGVKTQYASLTAGGLNVNGTGYTTIKSTNATTGAIGQSQVSYNGVTDTVTNADGNKTTSTVNATGTIDQVYDTDGKTRIAYSNITTTGITDSFTKDGITNSVTTNANGTTFASTGNGSTTIKGGAITTNSITVAGNTIDGGFFDNIGKTNGNTAGIVRTEINGDWITSIEGALDISRSGNISLNADKLTYSYNDGKNSGTLGALANKVDDIYDRTQGIDYDKATGTTTIDGNLSVKDETTTGSTGSTGETGIATNNGNITANTANIGGVQIGKNAVTATTGNFDNVAVGGTEGTSISKDGVTVGDKKSDNYTSITNNDVVVNNNGNKTSLADVGNRVTGLESSVNSMNNRLSDVEDRIDKVGAMSAAIANLRTMGFDPEAPTEIAIGVGQYKSETGLALGIFHYPNQDFMLSASISTSGDEVMGGIGATWKLGRKSAAEKAKDEEARRLEKAEEMKKLAQDAKVKAQAERHAKLLAEREAQKTA